METNERLVSLFSDVTGSDDRALSNALQNGLIKIEDLDEKDQRHRNVLIQMLSNSTNIPARFIKTATPQELSNLMGSEKNAKAASDEVNARIAANDQVIVQYMIDNGSHRTVKFPADFQKIAAPILMDLKQTDDNRWERVRNRMDDTLASEITKARSLTKRRETEAAIKSGERERIRKADPLLAAIDSGDASRMRKLDLEHLKPERWEKAKADWLVCPKVGVRAHLTRLPLSMVEPHLKLALEAAAEANLNRWELANPKWPLPKAVLKTLDSSAITFWLKKIVGREVELDAPLSRADLVDDLSPVLVMEALSNPEVAKLISWLDGLRRMRKVSKLAKAPSNPNATEKKMLESISHGLSRGYGGDGVIDSFAGDDKNTTVSVVKWLLNMDDQEVTRLGGAVLRIDAVSSVVERLFGSDLTEYTRFAEDI